MIIFAIPLRAKETSKDWLKCEKRFWDTIRSIFNQQGGNFRCIVACNDIPEEMGVKYDERLEFIKLDMPIPHEWIEMARDKFWKLTIIAVRIREILEAQEHPEKGIYVMPIDADDFLNCRIAEYCEKHPDEYGFASESGYVWQENTSYFRIYKNMHTYCGSCNIIKMYLEDLPESMPASSEYCHDQKVAAELNERYPIRWDHGIIVDKYRSMGRPFAVLPFKSTVYRISTGDNISVIYHEEHSDKKVKERFHPVAFLRSINILQYKYITQKVKKEFGIEEIN